MRVGNIMIDSYELLRDKIKAESCLGDFGVDSGKYAVVTLCRPSNVDDRDMFKPSVRNALVKSHGYLKFL